VLQFPTFGFAKSVNADNVDLDVFCDWVEANLLFDEDQLSKSDLIDTLCDENLYEDQDMASVKVDDAWTELRRRQTCLNNLTCFSVRHGRLVRTRPWQDDPGHAFCVLLAFAQWNREWAHKFGKDFNEQGEIFELLTKESMETQFPDWLIHQTGWSRTNPVKLAGVVKDMAQRLGESTGDLSRWAEPNANEAGLDLLCYRPFSDNRVGVPLYLLQCASGLNWKSKLKAPDINDWSKYIMFAATPRKAFATPFAFLDPQFIRYCGSVDGLLLDRYRLLAAVNHKAKWISAGLRKRIIAWAKPRVKALSRFES
jgi:hypothetical protein